jgi:aspartyl-tRNA(Asn)/glutamyl-tRNA(Gln) amidotransferase subunit A
MDHVAPMAATVGDAALLLEVLRDAGGLVPAAAAPMDRLRVGVPRAAFDDADPRVTALVEAGIAALERAGALVEPAPVPSVDDFAIANAAGLVISRCEAAAYHRSLGLDRARYWQEVREQLDEADSALALDYIDAQRLRAELAVRLATIFDHVDVLAMPTSPVLAPPVDDFAQYLMLLARNAIPWSLVGFPAISVPVGSVDGLPVGMQFVAGPDHESRLVSVARVIELEMSGHGANGATGSARHRIVIEGETP